MDLWKRFLRAGAGATVALALVTGPAVVAHADPGSRGSSSGPTDSRAVSGARVANSTSTGSVSNESEGVTSGGSQTTAAKPGRRARPSLTTAEGARTVRAVRAARTADAVSSGGARLRPVAPTEPAAQNAPQLTATAARASLPPATPQPRVAPVEAAAGSAAPPPVAAPVSPAVTQPPVVPLPMVDMGLPVLPIGSDPRPGQPMTSLFGILGLLMIPLAGAALGYRQARATAHRDSRASAHRDSRATARVGPCAGSSRPPISGSHR